jgi:hypothetical protein
MHQVTLSSSPCSLSSDGDSGLVATAATSTVDLSSSMSKMENGHVIPQVTKLPIGLQDMFSENSVAKIWRVAQEYLGPNVSYLCFIKWTLRTHVHTRAHNLFVSLPLSLSRVRAQYHHVENRARPKQTTHSHKSDCS